MAIFNSYVKLPEGNIWDTWELANTIFFVLGCFWDIDIVCNWLIQ